MTTKLFVYGTLKRGFRAHHLIADQNFLGKARTVPNYRLLDLGEYPGLAETNTGEGIAGELWEVCQSCLEALDDYEGAEYRRRRVYLEACSYQECVEAYVLERPDWGCPRVGAEWLKKT